MSGDLLKLRKDAQKQFYYLQAMGVRTKMMSYTICV